MWRNSGTPFPCFAAARLFWRNSGTLFSYFAGARLFWRNSGTPFPYFAAARLFWRNSGTLFSYFAGARLLWRNSGTPFLCFAATRLFFGPCPEGSSCCQFSYLRYPLAAWESRPPLILGRSRHDVSPNPPPPGRTRIIPARRRSALGSALRRATDRGRRPLAPRRPRG